MKKYLFDVDGVLRDIIPGFIAAAANDGFTLERSQLEESYGEIKNFPIKPYALYRRWPYVVNAKAVPYKKAIEFVNSLPPEDVLIISTTGPVPAIEKEVRRWIFKHLGPRYEIHTFKTNMQKIREIYFYAKRPVYVYEDAPPNIVKLNKHKYIRLIMPLYPYNEHLKDEVFAYYNPQKEMWRPDDATSR